MPWKTIHHLHCRGELCVSSLRSETHLVFTFLSHASALTPSYDEVFASSEVSHSYSHPFSQFAHFHPCTGNTLMKALLLPRIEALTVVEVRTLCRHEPTFIRKFKSSKILTTSLHTRNIFLLSFIFPIIFIVYQILFLCTHI